MSVTFSKCIYLKVYFRIIIWFILNVPCIDESKKLYKHIGEENAMFLLEVMFSMSSAFLLIAKYSLQG